MVGVNNESVSLFAKFLNDTGYEKDLSKSRNRQTFICPDGKIGQFSYTTRGNKPQARQFYEDVTYFFTKMEVSGDILFVKVEKNWSTEKATRVIPKCGTRGYNVKYDIKDMEQFDVNKSFNVYGKKTA